MNKLFAISCYITIKNNIYTVEDIDLSDIDEDMVYGWFKQLTSALDYIHGEGIVHRDIKPSNLLVDKDLNIILTDFGISRIFGAKIKSEVEATRTVVTKTGRGKLVLGTGKYIAPEVEVGEEATPQADSYSLGVMLLRWLTGFYYCDNPGAIALLSRKKLNWLPVISQLVAPFGRRPEKYAELVKLLKPAAPKTPAPKTAAPKAPAPKPVEKKHDKGRNTVSIVMKLLVAAGLCAGGYFAWRYIKANEKSQQAQIEAIQRQMEAKEKAEAEEKAKEKRLAEEQAKREAEEKRLAEEKRKAREAKLAEERRIEASRIKIEKQNANELTVTKVPDVQEREELKEEKREFKVVEKLSDVSGISGFEEDVAKIIEEANFEIAELLDPAKQAIKDAQKQKYELTRLGYLELDGKDMIVRDKSGNLLYKAPIGDVKKVVLSDLDERTKVDNIADMSMVVYPNPTMDELFVQGMQVGDVLRVYTVDGVFVKEQNVESEVTLVNVSDLAVGSYLIQSGDNIVKFIKE